MFSTIFFNFFLSKLIERMAASHKLAAPHKLYGDRRHDCTRAPKPMRIDLTSAAWKQKIYQMLFDLFI